MPVTHDPEAAQTAADREGDVGARFGSAARGVVRTALGAQELCWARLSIVLFAVAAAAQGAGLPAAVWIALYGACYLAGGWKPALGGLEALRRRRLDVDVLMVVAALAAAAIGHWLDGALLIVIFATTGGLEELATARTARGVRALLDLAPDEAALVDGAAERLVAAAELTAGDRIRVRPGERVAADGIVRRGETEVDESSITGEPMPVSKEPGSALFAGSMNGSGALEAEVTRPAADSVVARIVQQVESASAAKAPTQLFVERLEGRYSVLVVVATLALVAVPLLVLGQPFEDTLLRAMTFMIVASPCAVVLATMPPLLSAIATASRNGVLVRGAVVMERLGQVDAVAFDKTGTLTEGAPEMAAVHPADGWDAGEVLALAAAAERSSEHPLGAAIVQAAAARALPEPAVTAFRAFPGRGVQADVGGRTVRVGNTRLCSPDPAAARAAGIVAAAGHTPVLVDVDGRPAGVVAVADRLRPDATPTVGRLRDTGVRRTALLTGDRAAAAAPVAEACGIDELRAGLLPEDKVRVVHELQAAHREVLMLGDGVNDAPALAAAGIGVAMGRRGADIALETADVVLVTDAVSRLPALLALSRRANRVVRENLALAVGVIAVLIVLSLGGNLSLPVAVAAHEGSTLLVALNGLKLLRASAWPAAPAGRGPASQLGRAPAKAAAAR